MDQFTDERPPILNPEHPIAREHGIHVVAVYYQGHKIECFVVQVDQGTGEVEDVKTLLTEPMEHLPEEIVYALAEKLNGEE